MPATDRARASHDRTKMGLMCLCRDRDAWRCPAAEWPLPLLSVDPHAVARFAPHSAFSPSRPRKSRPGKRAMQCSRRLEPPQPSHPRRLLPCAVLLGSEQVNEAAAPGLNQAICARASLCTLCAISCTLGPASGAAAESASLGGLSPGPRPLVSAMPWVFVRENPPTLPPNEPITCAPGNPSNRQAGARQRSINCKI